MRTFDAEQVKHVVGGGSEACVVKCKERRYVDGRETFEHMVRFSLGQTLFPAVHSNLLGERLIETTPRIATTHWKYNMNCACLVPSRQSLIRKLIVAERLEARQTFTPSASFTHSKL